MQRYTLLLVVLSLFSLAHAQNVGIGTANPQTKLSIQDNRPVISLLSPVSARSMRIEYYEIGDGDLRFQTGTVDGSFTSGPLDAGTIVSMQRNGNVGVGTVDPQARLDVVGTNAGTRSVLLRSGNTSTGTASQQILFGFNNTAEYLHNIRTRHNGGAQAGNAIDFYVWQEGTDVSTDVGSRHIMTLDGNGFVGIGTTTPTQSLHIAANEGQGIRIGRPDDAMGLDGGSYAIEFYGYRDVIANVISAKITAERTDDCCSYLSQGTDLAFYTSAQQTVANADNSVERLRIKDDGDILVDGALPIQFERYTNLGDNISYNTSYAVADYCAAIVGMRTIDVDTQENGDGDAIRARMENVSGNWHIVADWRSHNDDESWDVDVMFVTRKMCSLTGY